jgi:hypothetical protein
MRKQHYSVKLTGRDLELFKFLHEYKVIDYNLAKKYFFTKGQKTTISRRFRKLREENLIQPHAIIHENKSKLVFTLTPKGFGIIKPSLELTPDRMEIGSASILHDLHLAEIGERFKSAPIVAEYFTENVLKSSLDFKDSHQLGAFCRLRSDAYLKLKIQEKEIFLGVEFERTAKNSERWHQKIMDYHFEDSIHAVLYICGNASIESGISKIEEKICKTWSVKVHTILLKDFFAQKEVAIFKNIDGNEFHLRFH